MSVKSILIELIPKSVKTIPFEKSVAMFLLNELNFELKPKLQ